jgi:prepilin-type N-terminal cleavage/methylation domain-containing protein
MKHRQRAFTLTEMLVAVAVLTFIVLLVTRLFNSANTVTTSANKRMDADAHARPLMDRMSIDFAQMVKRSDVGYYLKDPATPQAGNDQIAFFSAVPGYYPSTGSPSPISLVGYRTSTQNQMERMGKGLVWTGVSVTNAPITFLPLTITDFWPAATTGAADADYELVGAQAFRFEYYYLLRNGILTDTPWDTVAGHTTVSGLRDVAAVVVLIATIDPKSRVLLDNPKIATIAGTLIDFSPGNAPGWLASQWQSALDDPTDTTVQAMPRQALSAIRVYERYFYVAPR